jgi:hypothetical protein
MIPDCGPKLGAETLEDREQREVVANQALPFTIVMWGFWITLLWFALAWGLQIRFGQDPFLGWANVASRTLTMVGLVWVFCVFFFSWLLNWVMAPRQVIIGPDYVEGSPPRLLGTPPKPRDIVIRFNVLGSVRWNLLGPAALGGPNAPPGAAMLLSYKNAKLIRGKWTEWKRQQNRAPFADLPPVP